MISSEDVAPNRSLHRRRAWVIVSAVVALFAASAIVAVAAGGETPIAMQTNSLGWENPSRSLVGEPTELYQVLFATEDQIFAGGVGSPDQLFLLFNDYSGEGKPLQVVVAVDNSGTTRWRREFSDEIVVWPFDGGLLVFTRETIFDEAGVLQRLNPTNGEPLWQVEVTADPSRSADFNGRAYMTNGKRLTAVDLDSGAVVATGFHDVVGAVTDLRWGGGIAVRERSDVVILDADLNEVTRFPTESDGAVSYANGQVLALDEEYAFDRNTVRLYSSDGAELATLTLEAEVGRLFTIADGTWVYATSPSLSGSCGGLTASGTNTIAQVWHDDECVLDAIDQLDDGQTYVMATRESDLALGVFFNATTGEQVDIELGTPTLATNGFFTVSHDAGFSSLRTTAGEADQFEMVSVDVIDGGFLVQTPGTDETNRTIKVFGPGT